MLEIITVGLDLAKNVFQAHALTPRGGPCCARSCVEPDTHSDYSADFCSCHPSGQAALQVPLRQSRGEDSS